MGFWAEVRKDFYLDQGDINEVLDGDVLAMFSIDAWKTAAKNEAGVAIASVILSKHGDVLVDYYDTVARTDEMAQNAIKNAKEQLKEFFRGTQKEKSEDKTNDRFIRINGQEFTFEDVTAALGFETGPGKDKIQIDLCQRVNDGILVARGPDIDHDEYPGIDVSLELPPEKDSIPVMISRTEQPRKEGEDHNVRTYGYSRDDEVFLYFDADLRSDHDVEKNFTAPQVTISGNPYRAVEVYQDNSFVIYRGEAQKHEQELSEPALDLKEGMTGTIRDMPGIKKDLRGRAFVITRITEDGAISGTIAGKRGTYEIPVSFMENLAFPDQAKRPLSVQIHTAQGKSRKVPGHPTEKEAISPER